MEAKERSRSWKHIAATKEYICLEGKGIMVLTKKKFIIKKAEIEP